MGRGDLTDAEWERLRPFLPVSNRRCGRWRDHRQVIDGILHRVRTGVQWRDLPERFGPWKTSTGTSRSTPPSSARISMRPLSGRIHHQTAPERGRSLPPAVPDRHARAAGGLHPVQACPGENPGTAARAGQTPREARQPGRPPTQGITRRTARFRRRAIQETEHRRAGHQQAQTRTGRGDSLRQARIRLPRHHDSGSRLHLASSPIALTRPQAGTGRHPRSPPARQ